MNAGLDQNSRQTLTALSSVDHTTIVPLWADPTTHRLLTDNAATPGTVTSITAGTGLSGGTITTTGTIALATALQPMATLGTGLQYLRVNAGATALEYATLPAAGTGTVTTVSVATANGFSGTVANATTTPAITIIAGVITPTSVNGLTLASQAIGFTIAGGTTSKTLTVPLDASVSGTNTGDQNLSGYAPINSPTFTGTPASVTPTAGDSTTQIATTAFVQQAVRSVPSKEASKYATTTALATVTYYNGVANDGVGATLTGVGLGAITLDGNTPIVGDRLLVKNQASTFQNGIYTVTIVGTAGTVFVLTRALDFNQSIDIKTGASTYVTSGSTLAATTWDVNSADSPVIGTDAITFIQSAGPGSLIAGTGISITGVTVAIDSTVTTLTGSQTLTNKTLTTPVLTGLPTGTGVATANTVSTLVARDASGNFSAGTITAALTGTASGNLVSGGALGTPSSGTATNLTGLPAASVVAGVLGVTGTRMTKLWATNVESTNMPTVGGTAVLTSLTAPQFTTIELGAASDTTLARVSAGVISVEGVTIPTISSTSTFTNKRTNPRVVETTSYTTDTGTSLDVSTTDIFVITAQAGALLFNAPGGTPVQGQSLVIRIKDSGTARALTWNAVFRAMGTALPSTTVLSKTLYLGFFYNATDSKFDLVASAQEA